LKVENLEENFDLGEHIISYNATIDINNVFVSLYLYDPINRCFQDFISNLLIFKNSKHPS
jgi:hypothetical protein